jgi:uncharacterized protein YjcR
MNGMTTKEVAEKWGITPRQISAFVRPRANTRCSPLW